MTNLEKYRRMLHTVNDLEGELDALRSQSPRLVSSVYSTTGGGHGGDGRGIEAQAIRLADAETRYITVLGELADLRQKVDEELALVEDDLTRELFELTYVDGMTVRSAALRLEITERYAYKLKTAGLKILRKD